MLNRIAILASMCAALVIVGCSKSDQASRDTAGGSATESAAPGQSEPGASDPAAASSPSQQEVTGTATPTAPAEAPADTSTPHQEEVTEPKQQ
jgi:hypothetical protein